MTKLQFPLVVRATYRSGAYETQTIAGLRSSSTSSTETAVQGLLPKIEAQQGLARGSLVATDTQAKDVTVGTTLWRITQKAA